MPALKEDSKLWIAHPKTTSKIVTDLNRESSWHKLTSAGYESGDQVTLDHVWNAVNFKKPEGIELVEVLEVAVEVSRPTTTKRKSARAQA
jgi:hypothetical protein